MRQILLRLGGKNRVQLLGKVDEAYQKQSCDQWIQNRTLNMRVQIFQRQAFARKRERHLVAGIQCRSVWFH